MTTNDKDIINPRLHLVAWEITRSCNLFCAHCRASARSGRYSDELTTGECFKVIDDIKKVGDPIMILTGGEPLEREDFFEIARYTVSKGLRAVVGTNGTMLTAALAAQMKSVPISRVAVSLDFPVPELQDNFRGRKGAFVAAVDGLRHARDAGIEVQVNSTVTKLNVDYLDDLLRLALETGAAAFHPFMLVPTGRGKGLESVELSPEQYESTLNWIYDRQKELGDRIFFKPTDAPHYLRVIRQRQKESGDSPPARPGGHPVHSITRGCLAGIGFCFISHRGRVQGCGYLDVEAGNVRQQPFDRIWADSPHFNELRDVSKLQGKCGSCEYKRICGGCRARAYEKTGNCQDEEPYCVYEPIAWRRSVEQSRK